MSRPWRDFLIGVLLTTLLIVGKIWFEHGAFGHQVEQMTMNLQQLRLAQVFRQEPGVVVVDISNVGREPRDPPLDMEPVTSREVLQEVIAAVAAQSPVAIGVDVLLDPPAGQSLTTTERHLLDKCLEIRRAGTPVFIAIFDGVVKGPDSWLGDRQFGDLAAYALVPRPSEFQTTTAMARTVDVKVDGRVYRADSLAQSLALAQNARELEQAPIGRALAERFTWFVRRERPVNTEHFDTAEFLINYGILPTLERRAVRATSAADIQAAYGQIHRRVVLIGRGQLDKTTDVFHVPARAEPVAGVYVHAAATYTLVSAPLFRLTPFGRVMADIVTALIPLVFVLVFRLRRQHADDHGAHRLGTWLPILMAVLVFAVGFLFVSFTRIMWTDCLMVSAALLLHGPLERLVVSRRAPRDGAMGGRSAAAAGGGH